MVVGAGPAGLFAALTLARAGARPVLIERGKPVDRRTNDVNAMQEQGVLDPDSNVQYGEGGAGAFSDGKLTCGIKSPHVRNILETFVSHGAPEEILIDQKPHIGTDRLKGVVASIREEIIRLGGTVHFETRLEKLIIRGSHVEGAVISCNGESREFLTDTILLCIGHSARDTVQTLFSQGLRMEQKPFAMGVRIEHPRAFIDRSQYGSFADHPALGAASYKLICHTPDGRGVYTFCMCPGGEVIAAASQPGGVVTNGMSFHARDGVNSNSALLVGVRPQDFGDDHPLAGFVLQRSIEKAAFRAGGGGFIAPAQRVGDFLENRTSVSFGEVIPSYRPGVVPADLRTVLPDWIVEDLKKGIRAMNAQLSGFANPDAVLTGPETRSSSPVRISRNPLGEAEDLRGLYPVGEGAGYAGGIVSAAADGITAALHVLSANDLI
ncbi:NAD(P)/FAD-dependent oxidoreductase [Aristaeella hokkaidonensis]|uniref:NAD(P)/FAD-dependent oxidoreductase n=1 Tax=Aristaeella hokkaidonensis TaxID=3046382 RepID=UPI003211E52A